MKFTRRPDLDPDTRIEIVKLAWLHQGVYGKMTQIAQSYHISRTFLYQLLVAAHLQLHILFSDVQRRVPNAQPHVEQLVLLLRLEGRCSIPSLASILKHLGHQPNSLGSLSAWLQRSGRLLPSTLSMASKKLVFYLSDEIFAIQAPILVTIDAPSTTILKIELASDRSAETWQAHFEALEAHLFCCLGMASDRGVGLVAGYHAAFEAALWVCDYCHAFQDLFNLLHQLERKAYGAIGKEDEAARKWENAKSEANFAKRLEQYEQAQQACEQAMALYDHLDLLLHLLRESLPWCSPTGKLRTVEGVRSEFTLLLEMIEAVDSQAIASSIKPIRAHIDDLWVPFQHVEAMHAELLEVVPQQVLDFLVLAWHHDHFYHSSPSKQKRDHQRERDDWLAFAEGLLDDAFAMLQALVFEKLDSIVRASSLVEMVHSFIRPYLNSCQGQITQETLNLIMFYHNHRRYKGGKRKGKAPRELLTGEPLEAEWVELLLQQVEQRQDATDDVSLASRAPLELMPHRHGHTAPSLAPQSQESLEHPADTEDPLQQPPAQAA